MRVGKFSILYKEFKIFFKNFVNLSLRNEEKNITC